MILRGIGVRNLVDDIPTLYDFYTEKLGFKVFWGERDGSYVTFAEADGKPAFSIFSKTGMSDYKGYLALAATDKSDQVVYCTGLDNIDAFYNELKNKGVEIMGEPQDVPNWGLRCFYIRDPEGNLLEIAEGIKE
jgi:catechol 2,3-dioxygenase-like lactoylglutathione lyase family enzyme